MSTTDSTYIATQRAIVARLRTLTFSAEKHFGVNPAEVRQNNVADLIRINDAIEELAIVIGVVESAAQDATKADAAGSR